MLHKLGVAYLSQRQIEFDLLYCIESQHLERLTFVDVHFGKKKKKSCEGSMAALPVNP